METSLTLQPHQRTKHKLFLLLADPQMLQRALTFVTRLKIQLHMCVSYTDGRGGSAWNLGLQEQH